MTKVGIYYNEGRWSVSHDSVFLGMDVINDALEAAVNAKDKSEWTPVSVNVAPATLTILSKQVRAAALHRDFLASLCEHKSISKKCIQIHFWLYLFILTCLRFTWPFLCPTAEWGGAVRVSGALPVFHGRGQRRADLCFHHGRGSAGFLLPHVLVRAQRCQSEWGRAGGLHGEWVPTEVKRKPSALFAFNSVAPQTRMSIHCRSLFLLLLASLPEMFGRPSAQPGLLPADPARRLGGPPGQEGGAESAGQL